MVGKIEAWNSKIGGVFQPFYFGLSPRSQLTVTTRKNSLHFSVTGDPNLNISICHDFSGKGYQPNISQIEEAFKTDVFFQRFFSDSEWMKVGHTLLSKIPVDTCQAI